LLALKGAGRCDLIRYCDLQIHGRISDRMFKLEVMNTAFKGKQFRFKDGLTIGSNISCQIRAEHQDMQDIHARFYKDGNKAMVEIGCKLAHILVNERDVVRRELRHGDELAVGPLKFKVINDNYVSSISMTTSHIDDLIDTFEKQSEDIVYDFAKEDLFYRTTKEPSLRQGLAFVIPSKDKFIDQAQVFLSRMAKSSDCSSDKVDAFMTCAKELVLNAHRHGHKFDESKAITLRYRDTGDKLSLTIEDQGTGFPHQKVLDDLKTKDTAQAARERYQAGGFGGLGFKLITQLADELVYNQAGNQVTVTVLKH
jgi:serine/threonine-protein kinase RsbW